MRSAEEFEAAKHLVADGVDDCAIARQLGIPRHTVRDWRCRPQRRPRLDAGSPWGSFMTSQACHPLRMPTCSAGISATGACLGKAQPARRRSSTTKGCVEVSRYSKHWPCLFPQHGPGGKHARRIALEPWQQTLVDQATEEFVLGLFTAALDSHGIPWTRSTKYIVSIYRKAATARLDAFIGPKDRAVPLNGVHYTA
jgi:hypothetical protein